MLQQYHRQCVYTCSQTPPRCSATTKPTLQTTSATLTHKHHVSRYTTRPKIRPSQAFHCRTPAPAKKYNSEGGDPRAKIPGPNMVTKNAKDSFSAAPLPHTANADRTSLIASLYGGLVTTQSGFAPSQMPPTNVDGKCAVVASREYPRLPCVRCMGEAQRKRSEWFNQHCHRACNGMWSL